MNHTPEPWTVTDADYPDIIHDLGSIFIPIVKEAGKYNADRIVACVNPMQGIEDPAEFVKWSKELLTVEGLNTLSNEYVDRKREALKRLRKARGKANNDQS